MEETQNVVVPDILGDMETFAMSQAETWPVRTNRASQIDDPCLRRLVYYRLDWEKQGSIPASLQQIFMTGNVLEPVIERIISQVGQASDPPWRIISAQTTLKDKLLGKYEISGHIDGLLQVFVENAWFTIAVVDIKTCNPNIWGRINSYDDLIKYPWTKKYRGQLFIYALGEEQEKCCILLVNKSNLYQIKPIWFDLDYAYAEDLLQKAQVVNRFTKQGKYPPKLNQPEECGRCPFAHLCNPELAATGNLQLKADQELEEMLYRREELSEAHSEYAAVERQMKKRLVEGQDILCGDYMITWNSQQRKVQVDKVPQETKKVWVKKIVPLHAADQVVQDVA